MKKQVLGAAIAVAMSVFATMPATAAPAEATLNWGGIIPGSIDGTDIALRAKDGGDIRPGIIIAQADGAFTTTNVEVRAFALKDDGSGNMIADPDTQYPDAINWSYNTANVTHVGVEGNAYEDAAPLEVLLNGNVVEPLTTVATQAGDPNMTVALSYTSAPTALVTPGDSLYATATLFAEADAGGVIPQ